MILSDLTKYSMTRSIARSLCNCRVSCLALVCTRFSIELPKLLYLSTRDSSVSKQVTLFIRRAIISFNHRSYDAPKVTIREANVMGETEYRGELNIGVIKFCNHDVVQAVGLMSP